MVALFQHLLSILTGAQGETLERIGKHISYGNIRSSESTTVTVSSSGFLEAALAGQATEIPEPPFPYLEGSPILFGGNLIENNPNGASLSADIFASAFYLLTRYEEIQRSKIRDRHGRFPGTESLPYRAEFLHRPVVDEYGVVLRNLLRQIGLDIPEPSRGVSQVYLTHDMDFPFLWHGLKPALREFARRLLKQKSFLRALDPPLNYLGFRHSDPNDCFDWISEIDTQLITELGRNKATSVHFVMAGGSSKFDGMYDVRGRHTRHLINRLSQSGATLGLHASYEAGGRSDLLPTEKSRLESVTRTQITWNRNHYLRSMEPAHLTDLARAGFTDDFTMGYADVAGFRVGTCRPYRWFDPISMETTGLAIHPMTVMDCTLHQQNYMGLDQNQAFELTRRLIEPCVQHGGEVNLLWHNTELNREVGYHRDLYRRVLEALPSWLD